MNERFTRFLKEIGVSGSGAEMNRYYLNQLSTHPDLMPGNVLDVLHELAEVATMAIVTNASTRCRAAGQGIGDRGLHGRGLCLGAVGQRKAQPQDL